MLLLLPFLPNKIYVDSYTLPSLSHSTCQSSWLRLTPTPHDLSSSQLLKGMTIALPPPCHQFLFLSWIRYISNTYITISLILKQTN